MSGNVQEMSADALEPYDGECFRAAPLRDPTCDPKDAGVRAVLGTDRFKPFAVAETSVREGHDPQRATIAVEGFRCAYTMR